MNYVHPPRVRRQRRQAGFGVALSLAAHACAVVLFFAVPYALWFGVQPSWDSRAITVAMTEREQPADEADVRIVTEPEEVTAEMVDVKIEEVVERSETLGDEEKLEELDRLTGRLNQVSTAESIDALSGQFHAWLGTKRRAIQPSAEPPAGEFDFNTAQFHDVRREKTDDGSWRYVSVLLDAEGRTMETELQPGEGAQLYETLQRIKANPLLKKVYRQIVMPLLDQMIDNARRERASLRFDPGNGEREAGVVEADEAIESFGESPGESSVDKEVLETPRVER